MKTNLESLIDGDITLDQLFEDEKKSPTTSWDNTMASYSKAVSQGKLDQWRRHVKAKKDPAKKWEYKKNESVDEGESVRDLGDAAYTPKSYRTDKATCTHPRKRQWKNPRGNIICGSCNSTLRKNTRK